MQDRLRFFAFGYVSSLPQDRQEQVNAFPDQVRTVNPALGISGVLVEFLDHLRRKAHRHLGQIDIALRRIGISLRRSSSSLLWHVRRNLPYLSQLSQLSLLFHKLQTFVYA